MMRLVSLDFHLQGENTDNKYQADWVRVEEPNSKLKAMHSHAEHGNENIG